MALSSCVKCGQHSFELKEAKIATAKFKMFFVQCSYCGGVVGTLPYEDTNSQIHEVKKSVNQARTEIMDGLRAIGQVLSGRR